MEILLTASSKLPAEAHSFVHNGTISWAAIDCTIVQCILRSKNLIDD